MSECVTLKADHFVNWLLESQQLFEEAQQDYCYSQEGESKWTKWSYPCYIYLSGYIINYINNCICAVKSVNMSSHHHTINSLLENTNVCTCHICTQVLLILLIRHSLNTTGQSASVLLDIYASESVASQ